MKKEGVTSIELVKTFAPRGIEFLNLQDFRTLIDSKGFDLDIIAYLGNQSLFGKLFSELVLRTERTFNELDNYATAINFLDSSTSTTPYIGNDYQNGKIGVALANSGTISGNRRFGDGSATFFGSQQSIPNKIRDVPIAIIGYGAAGILANYGLRSLGFYNVKIFDKNERLGIWSYEHVYGQSRNNPLRLQFYDEVLQPAPGGGDEVKRFLQRLSNYDSIKKRIVGIKPKKGFAHELLFADGLSNKFPIIINTIGLGKPKPVSNPDKMTTPTPNKAGLRWQTKLNPREVNGNTIILNGLGNSTAEMLRQLHVFIDQGVAVDYRVITHYPRESIDNPNSYVFDAGRSFRVFRDTSKPNLVDYQGDLPLSRYDYFRALHNGKIISDVKEWEATDRGTLILKNSNKQIITEIAYDKIMTLIGYQQTQQTLTAMGCQYDSDTGHGLFDYDGEVIAKANTSNSDKRLHKGYFGFGSILETPLNPNAIVIPGMLHKIGDLLFSVIIRACELRKELLLK